jgi:hypothetical protein
VIFFIQELEAMVTAVIEDDYEFSVFVSLTLIQG